MNKQYLYQKTGIEKDVKIGQNHNKVKESQS